MKQLQVFISYRQADGSDWAHCLHRLLHGRSTLVRRRGVEILETLSVYLDQNTLSVNDWQERHSTALERAAALIVICTTGARTEFTERKDWFYHEIRWWLQHRDGVTPTLITPYGADWIPEVIRKAWPNAQHLDVSKSPPRANTRPIDQLVAKLLGSIALSAAHVDDGKLDQPMNDPNDNIGMIGPADLFMWEKDRSFRYTNCNDNYARIAGYDSPRAMVGKTDDDMPWRPLADFFRAGDHALMSGTASRKHVTEQEITVDGVIDILVFESRVLDRSGECVGVTGYFEDITGYQLVPRAMSESKDGQLALGCGFGDESLSAKECDVFKELLSSRSASEIAFLLQMGRAEVESHIASMKRKLQCTTEGDIIVAIMSAGLPLSLFGPRKV